MQCCTRDIRGGLGERNVFRICIRDLAKRYPESINKNIQYIAKFGRFDDLLSLMNTPCEKVMCKYISEQFMEDYEAMQNGKANVSLLAKWMPSVNTSSKETVKLARKLAKFMNMKEKEYRRSLAKLRTHIDIIENHLREKDYTFEYQSQPSKALFQYKKAFLRNDATRYKAFLNSAEKGDIILKTGSLYPYDIIRQSLHDELSKEEIHSLDVTWKSLKKNIEGKNAIAVVDGSGSMYSGSGTPMPFEAALSLGIYFAEQSKGIFANHFITFSSTPRLVEIKGGDIVSKARYVASFHEVANTNIEAVFELILRTALKNHLPQKELPETIYIISDMEFDCCTENSSITNYENAKIKFQKNGYNMPEIIFWNVNSRTEQVPVQMHQTGTALISGSTPKIFQMICTGELEPMKWMLEIVGNKRYLTIIA